VKPIVVSTLRPPTTAVSAGVRAEVAGDVPLPERRGVAAQRGDAVDHVHDEVEAVEIIEHHHVERRRRGAL